MSNKDDEIITKNELTNLEIGTVLVEYFPTPGKPKDKNYAIVTEDGLKYFQYDWYLKKFAYDPAEYGIGVEWNLVSNSKFKKVEVIKLKPFVKKETKHKLDANKLYAVEWEESEAGWGTRPDGFTFHISQKEAKQYIVNYWNKQPKEVPSEYSRPVMKMSDDPAILVEVSESLKKYVETYGSVWLFQNNINSYKTYDANEMLKNKELLEQESKTKTKNGIG